jgi:hypothetical protein
MKNLAVKQRGGGGGGPRMDIEAAGIDEARGLLNEDDSERDNHSHSSKELKIRSSAASSIQKLIFFVATTALLGFGGYVVLRRQGTWKGKVFLVMGANVLFCVVWFCVAMKSVVP